MSRMFEENVHVLPYKPPKMFMEKFSNILDKDVKKDKGKLRLDLVQPEFIEDVAEVLTFGAEKYPANSWQEIPDAVDRYYAALMRHLIAWRKGEKSDDESSISHLAHAATNMMFLLHFERSGS